MIIGHERDVTAAVLAEAARTPDPRLRALITAVVTHLHAFVRETRLTEPEFQQLCSAIARAGQLTNASHNEVVLAAGSLGVSALVCLLNNGQGGQTETTANLLGPFWRLDAPRRANGDSILQGPTPGMPLFVTAQVVDLQGAPVAGAEVDVWQASPEGYYENQDPQQPDMNLRGTFTTEADGRIAFRSIRPAGYPVPVSGPVGELLRAQGRHNMRPAHVHFMVRKPGFKTQFAQVYDSADPHLDTDVQFGVTRALVGRFEQHDGGTPPAPDVRGPWCTLAHRFVVEPGESRLPRPPITGKAEGERPAMVVLQRTAAPEV